MRSAGNLKRFKLRGVSTVEFALVFPIFILLVFALIDFCFYFYYEQGMSHVVRNSLRFSITGGVKDNDLSPAIGDNLSRMQSVLKAAKEAVPPLVKFRSSTFAGTNSGNYNSDLITFTCTKPDGTAADPDPDLGGPGALVKMTFTQDVDFLTPLPRLLNPANITSNRIKISTIYKVERYE